MTLELYLNLVETYSHVHVCLGVAEQKADICREDFLLFTSTS